MVGRFRSRVKYVDGGSYGSFTRQMQILDEKCTDTIGQRGVDNPFSLDRVVHEPVRISGTRSGVLVKSFIPDNYRAGSPQSLTFTADAIAETRALMASNPNRALVDVPAVVAELGDIPRMIKELGDTLLTVARRSNRKPSARDTAHALARNNLSLQFGWVPLVSDINKLLNFQEAVERRSRELNSLYNKGGIKRRINLASPTATYNGKTTLQSSNFGCTATYGYNVVGKEWAVLKWQLTHPPVVNPNDYEIRRQARSLLLGFGRIEIATIWEVIPFSWMIDYFTNIGEVLNATRNTIDVTPRAMTIMRSVEARCEFSDVNCTPSTLKGTPGRSLFSSKSRVVRPTPSPSFSSKVGWLSPSQLSILGSLMVTKFL